MLDTTQRLKLRARFATNARHPFTLADLDALLDDHRDLAIFARRQRHLQQQLDQLRAQIGAYYGGVGDLRDLQRGHAELSARLQQLERVERAARDVLSGAEVTRLARLL